MQNVCLLSLICLSMILPSAKGWGYVDEDSWGADFPTCSGKFQSPIHVNTLQAKAVRSLTLALSPGCDFPASMNFTITDTNQSFGVIFPPELECWLNVSKGSFPARLTSMRFHMGSEHAIDSAHFGMESQWFFERNGTLNLGLSIMLAANFIDLPVTCPGDFAKAAIFHLPPSPSPVFNVEGNSSFDSWINGKSFFTYKGSMTTPPCNEDVDWIIVKEPVHIPRSVHLRFSDAMRKINSNFEDIGGNARPLRPLNGREVVYHVTSKEVDLIVISVQKNTNTHIVMTVMALASVIVIFALWMGSKIDAAILKDAASQENAQRELQKSAQQA